LAAYRSGLIRWWSLQRSLRPPSYIKGITGEKKGRRGKEKGEGKLKGRNKKWGQLRRAPAQSCMDEF